MLERYDIVIVGGGSAGCAAAARLSEDPGRSVVLLEAGDDPQPLPEMVTDPTQQTRLLFESPYVIMYPTPRKIDGSHFQSLSGRILGGGSSVNVMSAPRPMKHDLDTWASLGNPGWSWDDCLPILKRMESDQDYPDSPLHGSDGPIHIERPFKLDMEASPAARAFIERALSMGLPRCDDSNGPDPLGVCSSPYNIKNGKRHSMTVAYLDPARQRPNLAIVPQAHVTSLTLAGHRIESVAFQKDGQSHTVSGDQVVLCAGAYHSPQVLMLSGIGPVAELERHGIPVLHPMAGVGENYQDHAVVYVTYEGPTEYSVDWVVPRFRLIVKSDELLPCANFHIMMRPLTVVQGIKRMAPISLHLLEQRSRGRLSLQSTDPFELPSVDARMLEDERDLEAMTWAMRFVDELVRHPSMSSFYGELLQPGPKDDWATFALSVFDSYHHGSGTCQMAPSNNEMAVVDEKLKVHGLDNLWIADASIMPTVTHANTNLTSIMIGERVVDFFAQSGL